MKVRAGFVSNSSSSSFCILGTWNGKAIQELREKDEAEVLEYYSGDEDGDCVGVSIDILEDHSLKEARQIFVDRCKNDFGVDVNVKDVRLVYDSYYN